MAIINNLNQKKHQAETSIYEKTFSEIPVPVIFTSKAGEIIDANKKSLETLSTDRFKLIGKNILSLIEDNDFPYFYSTFTNFINSDTEVMSCKSKLKVSHTISNSYVITIGKIPMESTDIVLTISLVDASHIDHLESKNKEFINKIEKIEKMSNLGSYTYNITTKTFLECSQQFYDILGVEKSTFIHTLDHFKDFIHHEDFENILKTFDDDVCNGRFHYNYRIVGPDDNIVHVVELIGDIVIDHNNDLIVTGTLQNISESKAMEDKIYRLAYFDKNTMLPNIEKAKEEHSIFVKEDAIEKKQLNYFYINILDYKSLKSSIGIERSEILQFKISNRINKLLGDSSKLYSINGVDYLILDSGNHTNDEIILLCNKISNSFTEPINIDDINILVNVEIGIAIYPHDGTKFATLLKNAQLATRFIDKNNNENFSLYSATHDIKSYKRLYMESALIDALEKNEIEIYYQPQIDVEKMEIIGAEALVRWETQNWGTISPSEFLPIAQEKRLMIKISNFVVQTVCKQLQSWNQVLKRPIRISINVSIRQLLDRNFITHLIENIEKNRLRYNQIIIEITESEILFNEARVSGIIRELREYGIQIQADDFLTGYSTLKHLKTIEFDTIKIDRSFTKNVLNSNLDSIIIETIIGLGEKLNLSTIIEGVENQDQVNHFRSFGCKIFQGYYFSKPLKDFEFQHLISVEPHILRKQTKQVTCKDNLRRYFRVPLSIPLGAMMVVEKINNETVTLGGSKIKILDIGPGGLKFASRINLPLKKQILLRFHSTILGTNVDLLGNLVWKNHCDDDFYNYGVEFLIDENARTNFVQLLNKLQIHLKQNKYDPDYLIYP